MRAQRSPALKAPARESLLPSIAAASPAQRFLLPLVSIIRRELELGDRSIMARPNVKNAMLSSSEKESAVMGNDFEHGGGEVVERQARAIICTAKRALEEEEEAGGGGNGKLSTKKSLEWFLETRRTRLVVAAAPAAGVRHLSRDDSSSSCSN